MLTCDTPLQQAAIHLTKNLAVELGPRHILVNAIAPGFYPSKMASGLIDMQPGGASRARGFDAEPAAWHAGGHRGAGGVLE